MKEKTKRVLTRVASAKGFVLKPTRAALKRRQQEIALQQLKERLLREVLTGNDSKLGIAYQRAATEAAAVAWLTSFPQLFFPALFEEKVEWARRYTARQRLLLQRQGRELEAA